MNIRAKAAGLALLLTLGLSSVASAASGFVTGNVNLRAGPSTNYPVVVTLPAGDDVEIYGCLAGYSWCDCSWNGYRGWVSSLYLETIYEARRVRIVYAPPPIISFSFGTYWDSHYRHRHFYRDRDRYDWREFRRERRQDRRELVRERRRNVREEVRQDRRRERLQELRQERRRELRQDRRQERRAARQERRQDQRSGRRGGRQNCPYEVCN